MWVPEPAECGHSCPGGYAVAHKSRQGAALNLKRKDEARRGATSA
jgi:hypothetical protein